MQRYNPKDIEPKWQQVWEDSKIYQASEDMTRPKKYVLEYFPYPSGATMHVGHVRNYTIGDAIARYNRMSGYNVLHPMGWDAFGLPAENYAIKNKVSPRKAIDENTARFKQQLIQMGFSYDWSREIDSTTPDYYRWTQWFFLLLHKKGLAYQQESPQWWCDTDKTVLANEQVEAGKCWRCGNQVEKKLLKQWFFKITDYADRLLDDLDDLDWSDAIKSMQRNWIGRSKGASIKFKVESEKLKVIEVFTTRPDTLFGATFMVLAPEHPLVESITSADQKLSVEKYIKATQAKTEVERQETDRDKTGVFTGAYAINPINNAKIPVWISDYVLAGYGTGAIMAVPAHDERDYQFAKTFDLPIVPVIAEQFIHKENDVNVNEASDRPSAYAITHNPKNDTYCLLKWSKEHTRNGLEWPGGGLDEGESITDGAVREFTEETGYSDVSVKAVLPAAVAFYYVSIFGSEHRRAVKYIVELELNSEKHTGIVGTETYEKDNYKVEWLTKNELMARLSEMNPDFAAITDRVFNEPVYHGEGVLIDSGDYNNLSTSDAREKIVADLETKELGSEVTNYKMRDWLISRQRYWGAPIPIIHCPKDGAVAVPEDQLPVVLPEIESYEPSGDGHSPLANVPEFVNTTCPKCGGPAERETDTMDGFACSSWYFLRFADPNNDKAPFDRALADKWLPVDDYIGGAEHAVMHLLYARFWTKVMYDDGLINFQEPFKTLRNQGMILAPDGNKMSKSKNNTIEPGILIDQGYGADSVRIMELFIGPWNQSAAWSVEGMGGAYRFLNRVWTLTQEFLSHPEKSEGSVDSSAKPQNDILRAMHRTTKKVSEDLQSLSFNTAIAAEMETVNELYLIKAKDNYQSKEWRWAIETLLQLLAPFAPHIAEELWQQLGHEESIHTSQWPSHDDQYLAQDSLTIAIQVNGKLRGEISIPAVADEQTIVETAKANAKVQVYIAGKELRRTIYVPGKLVNFVV